MNYATKLLLMKLQQQETKHHLTLLAGGGLGDGQPRGKLMGVKRQPGKHFVEKALWVKHGLSYWTVTVDGVMYDEFTDETAADKLVASLNNKLGV